MQVVAGPAHDAGEQLVEAEPGQPFADAICALFDDEERRRALGERGQAYVREEFDAVQTTARLIEIYREAVDAATAGTRSLDLRQAMSRQA
jgi:glycosyltransferase involved in cell wall biosynthesis